jgi:hypothetical protein
LGKTIPSHTDYEYKQSVFAHKTQKFSFFVLIFSRFPKSIDWMESVHL